MRRGVRAATVAAAVAAVAAAGSAVAISTPDTASAAPSTVDWKPCPDKPEVDCSTVTVPIDWSKPNGPTIQVALARRKATDPGARIGSMLFGPGGPGNSGVAAVKEDRMNWPELQRRYDIVGLDPRGVGGSSPVRCDKDVLTAPYPELPRDDKEFAQLAEHIRKVAESCRALTGPLVDFVDSASVARDMDVIRAALGEKKLNYFGRSYGTLAGQQYAELFGPNVGRMLLDSNMDHSLPDAWQFMRSHALAVEESFGQFVAWCGRNTGCALHGQDVKKVDADLLARAERGELTEPGSNPPRKLTPQQFLGYVNRMGLEPTWKQFAETLVSLRDGKPAPAPPSATRFGEPMEAPAAAIMCQDWDLPVRNAAELNGYRRALEASVAPNVKTAGQGAGCVGWPGKARNPQHKLRWKDVGPVLMLNSRYDPSTPKGLPAGSA